ncbi:MAG: DUF3014 domain-containing protein [Xanthomonadaceae bacterium]|nr:DUF3014 domain-containing protein [Xanthomonadaceae bacterium]
MAAPVVETPPEVPTPAPAPEYPVPPPAPGAAALPGIDDSDAAFRSALLGLPGAGPLEAWLIPDLLIRRIVVTLDNLPRDRVALKLRPLQPATGEFLVDVSNQGATISPVNASRYGAALTLLRAIDDEALVALYFRWYPLFQKAYNDLGYPGASFNNRLIAVLDHLIGTPTAAEPLALVKPKIYWEYADPALESASYGRRLLWRIGSDNREALVARLIAIRGRIVTAGVAAPAR